jgi:hypothetical protein
MGPVAEAAFNYNSFTGRPVVGQYLMGIEPGLQYNERSTELAKGIGEAMNWSPLKIDHILNGYVGTLGVYVFDVIDTALKSETIQGDNKSVLPARQWYDYPIIKRLVGRPQDRGLQQDAYDIFRVVERAVQSFNRLKKDQRGDEAVAYIRNRQMLLGLQGSSNKLKQMMQKVRAQREMIARSDMPADWKRRETDQLDMQLNAMLRDIVPYLRAATDLPFFEQTFYSD